LTRVTGRFEAPEVFASGCTARFEELPAVGLDSKRESESEPWLGVDGLESSSRTMGGSLKWDGLFIGCVEVDAEAMADSDLMRAIELVGLVGKKVEIDFDLSSWNVPPKPGPLSALGLIPDSSLTDGSRLISGVLDIGLPGAGVDLSVDVENFEFGSKPRITALESDGESLQSSRSVSLSCLFDAPMTAASKSACGTGN